MSRSHAHLPSRRDVLRYGLGAAAFSFAFGRLGRALADESPTTAAAVPGGGKARQVVFLYMIGGASQFETVDPKPGTSNGGPTVAIPTAIPGVQIADSLPRLAKQMGDVCLVRSVTSREGNHDRARYLLHTGYVPNPTVQHASLGAVVSHEKGDAESEIPAYVSIGGPGAGAGYLGVHHAPFVVQDAEKPLANVDLPSGLTRGRRDARLEMRARLDERFGKQRGLALPEAQEAMYARARRLMDSKQLVAFDLDQEKASTREAYGSSKFGQGCLLARRLVEADVPFVEVMMGGWDTHDDNFNRVKALNADLDRGMTQLIQDLKSIGRLESTLVVWVGDFGRTPRITATDGRGHYPQAWSLMLAGGGVRGGRAIGATDAGGEAVQEDPVTVPDLFASFCHALAVDPRKTFHTNGRPITIADPAGRVVSDMFAA
jgi:hypothetical protein